MSQITASTKLEAVKPEELGRFSEIFAEDVVRVVNGQLDFATNFTAKTISVTFSTPSVDVSVSHGLGRVPIGYIIVSLSAPLVVYTGIGAWSTGTITLRASAAGIATLLVY